MRIVIVAVITVNNCTRCSATICVLWPVTNASRPMIWTVVWGGIAFFVFFLIGCDFPSGAFAFTRRWNKVAHFMRAQVMLPTTKPIEINNGKHDFVCLANRSRVALVAEVKQSRAVRRTCIYLYLYLSPPPHWLTTDVWQSCDAYASDTLRFHLKHEPRSPNSSTNLLSPKRLGFYAAFPCTH